MSKLRINAKPGLESNKIKPSTITRAAITVETKITRGKQLVEQAPELLIPDPFNPRPGDLIDYEWLRKYLFIGTSDSLCKMNSNDEYYIPKFDELDESIPRNLEDHYDFLRSLAYSIRNDGLIEPIEIFLADKIHDPDYFTSNDLEYGYAILEGHQRRLAAILAGVKTITCIQITDDTLLAKLKIKHRKLRRQLSENNLRKALTIGQNYLITKELFKDAEFSSITNKELSAIIGLNEEISGALKRICLSPQSYPPLMFSLIKDNKITFKWLRTWVGKSYKAIDEEINNILNNKEKTSVVKITKPRGTKGGAQKKSATFKIKSTEDSMCLKSFLITHIPQLTTIDLDDHSFKSLENLFHELLKLAKTYNTTRVV